MENALIIGASGGIGAALHQTLAAQGVQVTALSRRDSGLDLADPASIARVLGAVTGPFDLILMTTGILAPPGGAPEKAVSAIDPAAMAQVLAVNAIGPALVLAHLPRLLPKDRPTHAGVLSARVGSIGDNKVGGWHSYRASKAALNQILRGASIELARSHRQAVLAALHPGTVATPFTANYAGRHPTVPPSEAAANLLRVLTALTPAQTGGFYDWSGAEVPW